MISKVEIRNFQSHKHTVLEFIPGTNVIIGLSDSGKSAVFRAINWVITNRPLGEAFRSEWGGETRVSLHLDNGVVVERVRGASTNEYRLNGDSLKAFGTEPPEPVLKALRMDPANVQAQGDLPFLLSASPGEAARMLNKAASLHEIDTAIGNLRRSLMDTNKQLEIYQESQFELQEELSQFANLPQVEEQLCNLEQLEAKYWDRFNRMDALSRIVNKTTILTNALEKTNHVPQLVDQLEGISRDYTSYKERREKVKRLMDLLWNVDKLNQRLAATKHVSENLAQCESILEDYQDYKQRVRRRVRLSGMTQQLQNVQTALSTILDVETLLSQVDSLEARVGRCVTKSQQVSTLRDLIVSLNRVASSVQYVEAQIREAEKEYHAIAPDTCPICGEVMKK